MFAVPLLVYGIGLTAHQAVCVSMVAVVVAAGVGVAGKLRTKQIDLRTASTVAAGGLVGAPAGATIGKRFSSESLLVLFAFVVLLVAGHMLYRSSKSTQRESASNASERGIRRVLFLAIAGVVSGLLSGLLGIGTGFLIVPALINIAAMTMHRAIANSLFVTVLIGTAATASHLVAGQTLPIKVTCLFVLGSVLGYSVGDHRRDRLQPETLKTLFPLIMMVMAAFVILRNVSW